jgi:uridine nucleosidase
VSRNVFSVSWRIRYGFLYSRYCSDTFGISEGPPLHDPIAVAAVLVGTEYEIPFYHYDPKTASGSEVSERYEVTIVTEGTHEEASNGAQTGRTIAKLLEPGQEGVRIPRTLDIPQFWKVIEECIERADIVNSSQGRS